MVYNILDNAVKYCQAIPNIIIKLSNKGEKTCLEIIDNGVGIDNDDLDKIFQKFYRVSTGDVHDIKGFGLGLFYVKNVCKAHGWKVEIESRMGEGSKFIIQIPK